MAFVPLFAAWQSQVPASFIKKGDSTMCMAQMIIGSLVLNPRIQEQSNGTISRLDVAFRTGEAAEAKTRVMAAGQSSKSGCTTRPHRWCGDKGTQGLSDLACSKTTTIANYNLYVFHSDKNNLSNKRL